MYKMYFRQKNYFLCFFFIASFSASNAVTALEFEPGVGLGVEYNDNVGLTPDNEKSDQIVTSYVGASIAESEGTLLYNANTSFNHYSYMQDSFKDQRYFNLNASADWEMIKERLSWTVSDTYTQRAVVTSDSNTPNNIQDSNVFTFGADITFPLSPRQSFTLTPLFSQFYFEEQLTDNRQYSLAGDWQYYLSQLTQIGLLFSTREIDYFESAVVDTTFTSLSLVINTHRVRSDFLINLGATTAKRDRGEETTGFSGSFSWLENLSSHSTFTTLVSTDLTDTSTVALDSSGAGSDIQVTADVIRNTILSLAYQRDDSELHTGISANYRKVKYSDSPLDQIVQNVNFDLNYPFTQLLLSGLYVSYERLKFLDVERIDKQYQVGGNLRYQFSRKLHGLFDVQYSKEESTFEPQNYNNFTVFISLVYGFGDIYKPTRASGF